MNHYKERSWRETQSSTSAISFATSRIKQIIYKAKDQYLQTVVRDGPQSASHILQRVKKIGVGGRGGKTRARPLPLLLDHTWNPARSQQDHDDVCLHHFGKQECGTTMSVSKFLEETDVSEQLRQEVQWDISDLTVPEIESPAERICFGCGATTAAPCTVIVYSLGKKQHQEHQTRWVLGLVLCLVAWLKESVYS